MKANTGDTVKIHTNDQTYEGILMPSLELTGKNTTIIKLEHNGYNLGIDNSKIKKIELIKKYEPTKYKEKKIIFDKNLPTVSVLSIGGTISSKVDYRTGGVFADYTAKDFVNMMPELKNIANINAKKVMTLMSEDMIPDDWTKIASHIEKEIKKGVDGIVITQGTDTLHFTAHALSFMINCNIPIVITGSQRSIDRGSSDAFMNLLCSVKAAAHFNGSGIMTCLHGSSNDDYCLLIRGTKVRKMDTSRRDAFRPINDIPLAKVYPNEKINDFEILNKRYDLADRNNKKEIILNNNFEENTALLYVYPGFNPKVLEFYLKQNIKGLVIGATALGHVNICTDKSLMPLLKKYYQKKIPVIISSQTLYGSTNSFVYSNLRKLSIEANAIYVNDMHPEVTYIKLGWVLSQTNNYDKVKEMMLTNYKYEFSEKLTSDMFLY